MNPHAEQSCFSAFFFPTHYEQVAILISLRALEGIKDELLSILERSSTDGYKENDVDAHAVCELAENVRDAIMDYQVSRIPPVTHKVLR